MTEALYEFAYMKACSAHPHTRITANVQAVYEAHRLYVKRLEKIIQKLVHESSAEGDVFLKIYKKQQNATHMKDTAAVEEFYLSALSQADTSNPFFLSTSIALESRHCNFEANADCIMAALKKGEQQTSSVPAARIVALNFEGTSLQRDLRKLLKDMVFQNPLELVGLNDKQLLKTICRNPVCTGTTSSEQVTMNLSSVRLIFFVFM